MKLIGIPTILASVCFAACGTDTNGPGMDTSAPPFSIALQSNQVSVGQGRSVSTIIDVKRQPHFSDNIAISVQLFDPGITATVTPEIVNSATQTATLTFSVASSVAPNSAKLAKILAKSGVVVDSIELWIVVRPYPPFAFKLSTHSVTLRQNDATPAIVAELGSIYVSVVLKHVPPPLLVNLRRFITSADSAFINAIASPNTPTGVYKVIISASVPSNPDYPEETQELVITVTGSGALMGSGTDETMSAGHSHTCAITIASVAYCWGRSSSGRIGNDTGDQSSPVQVSGGHTFRSISAGVNHTCAVTPSMTAYCWGSNTIGQVGDGTRSEGRATPTAVAGGLSFSVVRAGGSFACGLTTTGLAYCWGEGVFGQLGNGQFTPSSTPVQVSGSHSFISLDVGSSFACALAASRTTYCWGQNFQGQLDNEKRKNSSVPVEVLTPLQFKQLALGGAHACGLTFTGSVVCWGSGGGGQLGNDSIWDRSTPTAVFGGLLFNSITAGENFTCGLTPAGSALCWGLNLRGQLGDSTYADNSLRPVGVVGGFIFKSLTASAHDHTCAVTSGGVAHCWGFNLFGQLGDGTTVGKAQPSRIAGGLQF